MESSRHNVYATSSNNYRKDMRYVFKPNSLILSSIGIWPLAIRQASKIMIVIYNLVLSFAIVPCVLHIIYDVKDVNVKMKLYGLLGFCITVMMKYCVLTLRQPGIRRCIEHVKSDWWQVRFESDRELMLKHAGTGRIISIICMSSLYIAGSIYHMILPFSSMHKVSNQTVRPFVYPVYSEFHQSQTSPMYELIFLIHCICGYTIYTITAGSCGLAAIFVTHVCGQIEMIASRLKDLSRGKNFAQSLSVDQRIAVIIKSHVRILRFSAAIDNILQEICLLEIIGSVFTMCLPEYYCMVDWKNNDTVGVLTYFLIFISCSFNMYILCYIGELLTEKSDQIGSMCFMIDWYQLPAKSVRSLILMIAMSSQPMKISAGRMIDLSLTTFGTVLKTSLGYMNFLRTLVI
ncbi:OrL18 [Eciton burchellii]|nr:OrL18 [Eciton burchellii]